MIYQIMIKIIHTEKSKNTSNNNNNNKIIPNPNLILKAWLTFDEKFDKKCSSQNNQHTLVIYYKKNQDDLHLNKIIGNKA